MLQTMALESAELHKRNKVPPLAVPISSMFFVLFLLRISTRFCISDLTWIGAMVKFW